MKWLVLSLFLVSSLYCAPAYNAKRRYQQPDGTTFTARGQGDEYLHWIETEDEEIILFNKKTKQFEYGIIDENELVPSGEAVRPGIGAQRAPSLHPKENKKEILRLWKEKRQKALKRRHGAKKKAED